jgi:hypothetical protein
VKSELKNFLKTGSDYSKQIGFLQLEFMLYGKGFSLSNLFNMRMFYIKFPKFQTPSGKFDETLSLKLSWSHYIQILKADNDLEISFYTKQCEKENWSVREWKRQMNSLLFHRLVLSKDKKGVLTIAEKGVEIQKPENVIKDHFVVKYAIDNINNHLFVSKYKLYLPAKEDLERELSKLLETNEEKEKME